MRAAIKFVFVGTSIGLYLLTGLVASIVVRNPIRRRRAQIGSIRFWSIVIGFMMGIRVKVIGSERIVPGKPVFLVSNHVSFLDMMVLSAVAPAGMVTSVEVQETFGLGAIARLGGSLFVERRDRSKLPQEKQQIARVMIDEKLSILVFPEGTSSNAAGVLPFKAALFDCAIYAGVPVQPMVLHYAKINGQVPDQELLDNALYYGEMEFMPQFLRVLALRSLEVEVRILPEISAAGLDPDGPGRKDLSTRTHSLISETYGKLRPTVVASNDQSVSRTHLSSIDRPVTQR